MAQPKIGKNMFKQQMDLSPQEIEAREQVGIEPDAPLTEQEIAQREAERAALLKQTPTAEPETPPVTAIETREPVSALVSKFVEKARAADGVRVAEREQEARVLEAGMVTEAQSLQTRQGILRKKHLAKVEEAAAIDWKRLFAAVPEGLEYDEKLQRMIPRNHDALRAYRAAAEHARDCLRSAFGDREQGSDPNPVNLSVAARLVDNAITGKQTHDEIYDRLTPNYRWGIRWLVFWIEKGRALVAATEEAVKRFDAAAEKAKAVLAAAEPRPDTPAQPEPHGLQRLPVTPPQSNSTSYTDFDPRDHGKAPRPSGPEVTPIGAGDGFRVGGGR
jgi:hypothetical protein